MITEIKNKNINKNKVDWESIKQNEDYIIELYEILEKIKTLDRVKDKKELDKITKRLKEINKS